MSKLETLRHLPTPADVRQNVQQLGQAIEATAQRLDATAAQVQSLEQLPQLVADQVSETLKMLDPVLQLPEQVNQALEAFDRVNSVQRQALEQMGQELARQASKAMESRLLVMDKATQDLTSQASKLTQKMGDLGRDSKQLLDLPHGLKG